MSTTKKTALQGGSEMRRTDAAVDISTTRQIVTTCAQQESQASAAAAAADQMETRQHSSIGIKSTVITGETAAAAATAEINRRRVC